MRGTTACCERPATDPWSIVVRSELCSLACPRRKCRRKPLVVAGFKCVQALGRIIIRGPYPPPDAIIYMHLQL